MMSKVANIDQLPFPVAYPLHWARDPDGRLGISGRRANAVFACYQAMRLAALLMLADYLEDEETEPSLASRIRGLRMPHWQEWSRLADELARFWTVRPERRERSRFPSIAEGWMSVSRVKRSANAKAPPLEPLWEPLIAGLAGVGGTGQARSADDAIWELRNRQAHRSGTVTPEALAEQGIEFARLLPLVEAVIARLFGDTELVLMRSVPSSDTQARVIRLVGPHPDLKFDTEAANPDWLDALSATEVAAASEGDPLSVYPLLIPTDEEPAAAVGAGLLDPVTMIDGVAEAKLTVLGVRNGAVLAGRHLNAALAALRKKHADLTVERNKSAPWTLAPWSRMTATQTLEDLTGTKYFPGFYFVRPDVDGAVERYEGVSGRALLLLGEAGSGKSSLMARLADRLLGGVEKTARSSADLVATQKEQNEDIIAYLSGPADYRGTLGWSADQWLLEAVTRKLGVRVGAFESLKDLFLHLDLEARKDERGDRKYWLLLDGINEAERFVDLVHAIDRLLPDLDSLPQVRLVISMRTGAYRSLATYREIEGNHGGAAVFEHTDRLLSFPDEEGRERPWLTVRPFSLLEEGPRAYALRQESLPARAAAIPYDRLPPLGSLGLTSGGKPSDLRRLLLNPLYLHLFHIAWAGRRSVPADLDEGSLLDAYLDHLVAPRDGIAGAATWLDDLARVMVRERRAILPLADADRWSEEWRRDNGFSSLQAVTKLGPVEELVAASVLLRPAEIGYGIDRQLVGYQFTQQKLAERVLLRHLDRGLSPAGALPSRKAYLHWTHLAAADPPFSELAVALADWTARLVRSEAEEAPGTVATVLDIDDTAIRATLLNAAIVASATAEDKPVRAVFGALVDRALALPDGYDRLYLTSWDPAKRLDDTGSLDARRRLREALLVLIERLATADPGNAGFAEDLAISLAKLSGLAKTGAERSQYLRAILAILQPFLRANRGSNQMRRIGEWAAAQLKGQ